MYMYLFYNGVLFITQEDLPVILEPNFAKNQPLTIVQEKLMAYVKKYFLNWNTAP